MLRHLGQCMTNFKSVTEICCNHDTAGILSSVFSAQNLTTARGCFPQSLTKSHVFERYVLSELNYNRKEVVMY